MIEVRGFGGKLNLDDNPYRSPKEDHVDALNITRDAQGEGQDVVTSNIIGNSLVPKYRTNLTQSDNSYRTLDTMHHEITFGTNGYPPFPGGTLVRIFLINKTTGALVQCTQYASATTDTISDIVTGLYNNFIPPVGSLGACSILAPDTLKIDYSLFNYEEEIQIDIIQDYYMGTTKVIGNYADRTRNRLYYFVWSENGYDRINYYDASLDQVFFVMENYTDTGNVNVLNFDASYRINHIDIIYREEEGDLLFWTDGLNPPRKINIQRALDAGYGVILSSYLDVAKEPPSSPPYCVYEDNAGITVNNLNNKQFKFKYRFVFDDLEKSVTSAQCEVPLPKNYTDQAIISNPEKNSSILLVVDTGEANVKKIEILGAESLGTTYSDFFLITVLDKAELNLLNNNTAQFKFFNDQAYVTIPLQESIQPFDNVPQVAYTQTLPNGNVLDYGAITESYDLITPDYQAEIDYNSKQSSYSNQTALVLIYTVTQPVQGIKVIIAGTPTAGDVYTISYWTDGLDSTPITQSITATGDTTASLAFDISSYFTGLGYTVEIDGDGNLIVSNLPDILEAYLPTQYDSNEFLNNPNSILAYDWSSRYSYGVVYFDEKGRTNSVITNVSCSVQTQQYDENVSAYPNLDIYIPQQTFTINSAPPEWARYFEIVRTKNLTKSKFLYWISDKTAKDSAPNDSGYQYAYISINTLTQYIVDNPEIKTLGYEFTIGDRIRFIKLYASDTTTSQIYNDKDFQIIDSVINPVVNGITIIGQVLKIFLPQTGIDFDFGTNEFNNYLIEIYTPAPNFSNDLNLYYEFGEKYAIGLPGTVDAFHEGMIQDQNLDINQPAIYRFWKGDSYFRFRTYSLAGPMKFNSNAGYIPGSGFTGGSLFLNNSNSADYTPYNSFQAISSTTVNNNNLISFLRILNLTKSYTFRVKGLIKFTPDRNLPGFILNVRAGSITSAPIIKTIPFPPMSAGVLQNLVVDDIFVVPTGAEYVLFDIGVTGGVYGTLQEFPFVITESLQVKQGIIDPNFSDTYNSSASVDGRAWKFDPNAKRAFNPTLIRFGGEFQPDTTVNNINRFYEEDFDLYDRSRGSIKKMFIEGRNQYIFQQYDVGVVTVLTQIVRDTAGNPLSAQSDKLLNKIVYPYIGQFGIGNVPESFAYGKHAKYFVDPNKGVVCRLSADGITPLSIMYKTNAYFVAKLALFKDNVDLIPSDTGTQTVYGVFDAYTNKYIVALSEVTNDGDVVQEASTLSFVESRDQIQGFESFYSFHPENMGDVNNLLITFKDGQLWKHTSSVSHCNFYGDQYDCYIDIVFNDTPLDRKTFSAIMQTASSPWYCPSIKSQVNTYGSTPQQTYINEARFNLQEGQYNSAILRDINSSGGLINGDTIKGNYLIVRFQKGNPTGFNFINTVSLKYITSPLNVR